MTLIPLAMAVRTVALLFHKPANLVCSHRDEHGRETVYDRILADARVRSIQEGTGRLHAVGRLDQNTTGLLLLSNDGRLVQHCTDPTAGRHCFDPIEKMYQASCRKLNEAQLASLRGGVQLSGGLGMSRPAEVQVVAETTATSTIQLTLREGKNRQIRRMLHGVGSACFKLHRLSFGGLTLEGVNEGEWRLLGDQELRDHLRYAPREFEPEVRAQQRRMRRHSPKSRR